MADVYFDLDKTGAKTSTNDIELNTEEIAIREGFLNGLEAETRTRIYKERNFGFRLNQFLFEPIDNDTAHRMLDQLDNNVTKFTRIRRPIFEITFTEDEQDFIIKSSFEIDESERILELETTLNRIR